MAEGARGNGGRAGVPFPARHGAERLAAIDGVDDWARAAATPAEEEITRIRRLITRIKTDLADLAGDKRAAINDAITIMRRHRAVSLGMPALPSPPPAAAAITEATA